MLEKMRKGKPEQSMRGIHTPKLASYQIAIKRDRKTSRIARKQGERTERNRAREGSRARSRERTAADRNLC